MTTQTEGSLGKFKLRYKSKKSRQFKNFTGDVFTPAKHGDRNILMIVDPATIDPSELKDGESLEGPIYRTLRISNCFNVKAQ